MYELLATDDGDDKVLVCAYEYEHNGQAAEEQHATYTISLADAIKLREQLDEVITYLQPVAS